MEVLTNMPAQDGTGPRGMGPRTGRGLGPCGTGYGRGYGMGYGRGRGYGQGYRMGYGPGYAAQPYEPTKEEQKKMIEAELKGLDEEKKALQKMLKDLKE